jgi:peptidyl-dipeptidase A
MIRYVSLAAIAMALASAPVFAQAPLPQQSADAFVAAAERDLNRAVIEASQAEWVYQTYINRESEAITARADAALTKLSVANALEAARQAATPGLSYDTKRKLDRMRTAIVFPAPTTPGAADELSTLKARLQGIYGKGQGTLGGKPINGSDIEAAMGTNRNPAELREMWSSWHDSVGKPMAADYTRMVALANQGAKELGYGDVGALWRSNYDMTPEAFAALTEKRGQAALRPAALLHPCQAQRKIRRRRTSEDGADPRRSARQHVGAGMGQHLRCGRPAGHRRHRLRHDAAVAGKGL